LLCRPTFLLVNSCLQTVTGRSLLPPSSLRAIAEMLPGWIKADHKRVGRRLERLTATGTLPQLDKTLGRDGRRRRFRRMYPVFIPEDFTPRSC
jgi:hypothetical protein